MACTYRTHVDVDSRLEVAGRMEVATGLALTSALNEVNACRHRVVMVHVCVLWRMRKAAFLLLTIA